MGNIYLVIQLANELRKNWGLGPYEPIRFRSLLLKLKVLTVFKKHADNFAGMAIKCNGMDFILINCNMPLGRQHFTICHELFHLYGEKGMISSVCHSNFFAKEDKKEYNADLFASYLLMPPQGVLELIPEDEIKKGISLSTILKIENYFSCSRQALMIRLRQMKLIDDIKFEAFSKNVIRGALQHGYPIHLYLPGNDGLIIGNYGDLARALYEENKISESHYIELLRDIGVDVENMERYQDEQSQGTG